MSAKLNSCDFGIEIQCGQVNFTFFNFNPIRLFYLQTADADFSISVNFITKLTLAILSLCKLLILSIFLILHNS